MLFMQCKDADMKEALETLITETVNLARERGHKPKVIRRGRSLRSRPPSAIVECEQCPLIANLITLPCKTERKGTLTQISCIVATTKK
jgi:hypothetical protein